MKEIRLHIYALSTYTSMDILATKDITLEELCSISADMMEKYTHGAFQAHSQTNLIRAIDGTWLLGKHSLQDADIASGETIYLL